MLSRENKTEVNVEEYVQRDSKIEVARCDGGTMVVIHVSFL